MTTTGEGWIDVSVWPYDGMVHWPADPLFLTERVLGMKRGNIAGVSTFSSGSRTGTRVYESTGRQRSWEEAGRIPGQPRTTLPENLPVALPDSVEEERGH